MANNQNLCLFTGRLGADPEIRHTNSGTAVASVRIAVGGRAKRNDQWEDTTEWVPLVFWGRRAEVLQQYAHKGDLIRVQGRFQTRKWQAQDGSDRYATEIVVDEMELLGGRRDGGQQAAGQPVPQRHAQQSAAQAPIDFDDDLPF